MAVHSAKRQGAQIVALSQAAALSADHELVIAIGDGPLRAEFARFGSLIDAPARLPIWGAPPHRWAIDLARSVADAIRLAIVARRRGARAIIAGSTVLVAPVIAARLARVPVLVCAHEAPTSRAARALFRFHGALADAVMAISPWIADAFAGARAQVVLCPVGISVPARRERPLGQSGEALRLLVAGSIDAHKRQDIAVAALAGLRNDGVDARLEIVGRELDVAYATRVRELASTLAVTDRVSFTGEVSDVIDRMAAADVVLVPAGEVTPLVAMEAMAVGTPVVAARMGSIPDVVIDGESGLIVEPSDGAAMATAIRRLADEPGLAQRLADAARTRVEQRFDQSRSNDLLIEHVSRLLLAAA